MYVRRCFSLQRWSQMGTANVYGEAVQRINLRHVACGAHPVGDFRIVHAHLETCIRSRKPASHTARSEFKEAQGLEWSKCRATGAVLLNNSQSGRHIFKGVLKSAPRAIVARAPQRVALSAAGSSRNDVALSRALTAAHSPDAVKPTPTTNSTVESSTPRVSASRALVASASASGNSPRSSSIIGAAALRTCTGRNFTPAPWAAAISHRPGASNRKHALHQ